MPKHQEMHSRKCGACGLVNFAADDVCRRCGVLLAQPLADAAEHAGDEPTPARPRRGFLRSVYAIVTATVAIVAGAYLSLLLSSDGLGPEQHQMVDEAIHVIERAGFTRESRALRYFVSYRSSDNWWNRHVGHQNAYAATNYPFAVITLYPAFFRVSADATERAAVLLHEAQHVFGANEHEALQRVWMEKGRLGWTAQRYSRSRVWRNTQEWTVGVVPALFQCGFDGQSDCVE